VKSLKSVNLILELEPKIDLYNSLSEVKVTRFELETIIALLYFYRKNVDIVILEVGLGGLYDCTNIITKPLVSIITSIGYDHMHILGNSLEEIALQKAGIIKNDSETILYSLDENVKNVFIEECKAKNNILHLINESDATNYSVTDNYQYFDYKDIINIPINLKGKIQVKNAMICIETLRILQNKSFNINTDSIKKGLSTVIHRGRMEEISSDPLVIYDGAHNEPAILNLLSTLEMYYKNKKKRFIITILKRKDYKKMLALLVKDNNSEFIVTSGINNENYTSSDELYLVAKKINPNCNIKKMKLIDALEYIKNDKTYANFIIGTFYIYATVYKIFKGGNND